MTKVSIHITDSQFLTPEEVYNSEFKDLVRQTSRASSAKQYAEDNVSDAFLRVYELFYSAKMTNPFKIKALVAHIAKMKSYKEANRMFKSYNSLNAEGEEYFLFSNKEIDDSTQDEQYNKVIEVASQIGLSEREIIKTALNLNGHCHGNIKDVKAKETVSKIKREMKLENWKSFRQVEDVVVSYNADGSPITGKAVAMGVVEYKIKRTGETKYKATYYIDNKIKWKACDTLEDAIELTKMFPKIHKKRVKGIQSGYTSVARFIKQMTTNRGNIVYVVCHPLDKKENKKKIITKRFHSLEEAKEYAQQYY